MHNKKYLWRILLIALCIGALATSAGVGMDRLLHEPHRQVFASDIVEGLVAAVVSGFALASGQRRRRELLVRMQAVEDVNHHVRNAMSAITYSAALKNDRALANVIDDANQRVDWVLREVLSKHVLAKDDASLVPNPWPKGRAVSAGQKE